MSTRKARPPKGIVTHAFLGGAYKDWDDEPLCEVCGHRKGWRVHSVVVPEEAREIDERRIGERE